MYAVIGPGSVGSLVIYALNRSGIEPLAVYRSGEPPKRIRTPRGDLEDLSSRPVRIDSREWLSSDILLICVKAYSVADLEPRLRMLPRDSLAVAFQNGVDAFERLRSVLGASRTAQAVLNQGVYREGETVLWSGGSEGYLGPSAEVGRDLLERVSRDLSILDLEVVEKIEPYMWLKLAVNCAINPVTAILRERNSVVVRSPWAGRAAALAAREVEALARLLGVPLPRDPVDEVLRVAEATGGNVSSMLSDIVSCRRTEIDHLNGYVVRRSRELGLEARANELLYNLVKHLESAGCGGRGRG